MRIPSRHIWLWLCSFALSILLFGACKGDKVSEADAVAYAPNSIVESGELFAVDERSFVMPRFGRYWYEMKLIGVLEHGSPVKAGDSLFQFDPAEVKKFIIDRETQLESEEANLQKLLVQQEIALNDLRSTLRSEEASFDLKKLEMEYSRFESDRTKQVKALEFRQAEIRFNKTKKRLALTQKMQALDLKIQRIRHQQLKQEVQTAYEVLPQLTIRTPINGVFQIARKRRSRDLLTVGDEIQFGTTLGNVPDLTWMKAVTTVNETDFTKIHKGQKVRIRLDAMPDVSFEGKVSFISVLCRQMDNNDFRKVFDVEVTLTESDQRLKPGMTVSCEFIIEPEA